VKGAKKNEFDVYRDPNRLPYEPTVIVKRKQTVDPKDIAGGWKLGKSTDDLRTALCKQEKKEPDQKVIVKRKTNIDPFDLGGGWKPNYKGKPSKPAEPVPNPYIDPAKVENEFKVDGKDIGGGWKRIGKVKESLVFKHEPFDKNKANGKSTEDLNNPPVDDVVVSKKPPIASKTSDELNKNKWQPAVKNVANKHPNSWVESAMLKAGGDLKTVPKSPLTGIVKPGKKSAPVTGTVKFGKKKTDANEEEEQTSQVAVVRPGSSSNKSLSKKNLITSTPNMSQRDEPEEAEVKDEAQPSLANQSLDQSIIENSQAAVPAKQAAEQVMNDDDLEEIKDVKNSSVQKDVTVEEPAESKNDNESKNQSKNQNDSKNESNNTQDELKKSFLDKIFDKNSGGGDEVNEDLDEKVNEKDELKKSLLGKIFDKKSGGDGMNEDLNEKVNENIDDDEEEREKNQLWAGNDDDDDDE
jgi:hypothetical protein